MKNKMYARLILVITAFFVICGIFILTSYNEDMDEYQRQIKIAEMKAESNKKQANEYLNRADCFSSMVNSVKKATVKTFDTVRQNIIDECNDIGASDLVLYILISDQSDIIKKLTNASSEAREEGIKYLEIAEDYRNKVAELRIKSNHSFIDWLFSN